MSVALLPGCLVVDAAWPWRRRWRPTLRALLAAHPAVRFVAHDGALEVAYVDQERTAELHELAAEVRRSAAMSGAREPRLVIVRVPRDAEGTPWLRFRCWERVSLVGTDPAAPEAATLGPEGATMTRSGCLHRLPAPLRQVRPPAPDPALVRVRQALDRIGLAVQLATRDQLWVNVSMPRLHVLMIAQELPDEDLVRLTIDLPVVPDGPERPAFEAALARLHRWSGLLRWRRVGEFQTYQLLVDRPGAMGREVAAWEHDIRALLDTTHAVGIPLVRVALGEAPPEAVDDGWSQLVG